MLLACPGWVAWLACALGCSCVLRPPDRREAGNASAASASTPAPATGSTDPVASSDGSPPGETPTNEAASEAEGDADDDEESASSDDAPGAPALAPAKRYAALDRAACEAELRKRRVSFDRVDSARGVLAPVRLTGPLSGVSFRSNLPPKKRGTAVIEIYDCRLVLALDDFAKILGKHDVVEVVHLSVYRPVSAKRALKNGLGRRHGGALAIDAAIFKTKDGRVLDVKKDFHGRIGAKTCPPPKTASELRTIACEASDAGLFNVLLTPDFNRAHHNHFHLEVTANARWFYVR
jgi:hypothetical protein